MVLHSLRAWSLVVTLLLAASACSRGKEAEESWRGTTQAPDIVYAPFGDGEEGLARYLAQVEANDSAQREAGTRFWRASDRDDPRRFSWLLTTTMAAPQTPLDLQSWSLAEAHNTLSGQAARNIQPLDARAREEWRQQFPRMRGDFLASAATTPRQRRQLEVWNLYNRMRELGDARARGDDADGGALADEVLELTARYPTPFDELDAATTYRPSFERLYATILITHGTDYFASVTERGQFLTRMTNSPSALARDYAASVADLPLLPNASVPASDIASIPNWATESFDPTPEGRIAAARLYFLQATRHAYLGAAHWASASTSDREKWLLNAYQAAEIPFLVRNVTSAARQRGADSRARVELSPAHDTWMRWLDARFEELAPRIDETGRARLHDARTSAHFGQLIFAPITPDQRERAIALFGEYARHHAEGADEAYFARAINRYRSEYANLGLGDADLLALIAPYARARQASIRAEVAATQNLVALKTTPFELSAPTIAGVPFDIASLRGKIVFLDHWITSCSSCLEAMPGYHALYLEYRDRGVEFVSVGYDARANHGRVARITREHDLVWTTLAGDDILEQMQDRFGWGGFPQYTLLDRDGRLYASTADIHDAASLRRLLDEMLAAEAGATSQ